MQVCALERTDKAFDSFYRRCEAGAAKKGYPRHRKRIRSLSWKLRKHKLKTGERVRQNPFRETAWKHDRLKVPKLGELKIYMHRRIQGDPKEVSLVKKASGWYAHISCELPDTTKVEPMAAIAVDMGTTHSLTTSEGKKEENPRWYRKAEGLTRKHSRDLSRKKLGGRRWKKQQHKLALHHERTVNKRKDFIGKLVYKLFHHDKNNVLILEDLRILNMVKNQHLSKSISDASWGIFFQWAGNIAERAVSISTKLIPRIPRKSAPVVVRNRQRNYRWQYELLSVNFVATLWIETTTLHETYFLGLLRPFVESGGLPPSMKRETTRMKRLALKTPISYRCLLVLHKPRALARGS